MSYSTISLNDGTTPIPENIPNLNNVSTNTFKCSTCELTFDKQKLLKEHKRQVHKRCVSQDGKKYKCEYCEKLFNTTDARRRHRVRIHHIKRDVFKRNTNGAIRMKFNSEQDFREWLTSEELKTKSHFVKARGAQKRNGYLILTYECNRSGKFVSSATGKRKLKKQGSGKLGRHCSAVLHTKIFYIDNRVEVTYLNEHNHELALHHLPLPTEVKEVIAEKLLKGESKSKILSDIRGNVEVPESRHHLVTRKDIHNIKSKLATDPEYSSQLNSCDVERSSSPNVIHVIDQNIYAGGDGDTRNKLLSKLIDVHNKVAFMPGLPNSTATYVMRALKRIEERIDRENDSLEK